VTEREASIRAMLPIVKRIAKHLKHLIPALDVDDLIGDGCIGLIRAIDCFDARRGTLDRFVRRSVLGAMLNGLRRMDPVSERTRRIVREGEAIRYSVAVVRGSVPGSQEIDRFCPGYSDALAAVHMRQPLSLDRPAGEGEAWLCDLRGDPARLYEERCERQNFAALLDALPPRERNVIVEHYFAGYSLRRIGRRMEISPQRASQLHLAAIKRMKQRARAAAR
jgi:RNA polymerase sigma factor for flagellar operon FliA